MTDLESRAITIRPIISYPREAEVGKTYLMSIDIQAELGEEDWPYAREDYALHCFLDTKPLFNHQPFGEPVIVLNRFGGTYGPAIFLLTAATTPQEGAISVSLVNEQGMPLHQVTLPNIYIRKQRPVFRKPVPSPEKQSRSKRFQAYFEWLFNRLRNLSLAGIDPQSALEQNGNIDFSSIYIPPRVIGPDQNQATPVISVINQHRHLVILGDPRSGKSSLLNYLALCMSGEGLENKHANLSTLTQPITDTKKTETAWNHGLLLPIIVVLRDFAARGLPPADTATAQHFWDFILDELTAASLEELFPHLKKELLERGGLILFDGFDEVPNAEKRRVQIRHVIKDLVMTLPKARFVITSRPYAYQRQDWQLEEFQVAVLTPFSIGQINSFVDRWYAQLSLQRGLKPDDAQGRAEQLKKAILSSSSLRELAARPLLLTLMVSLHAWRGGSLPEKREQLYADSVDLLLSTWESQHIVRDEKGQIMVMQPGLAEFLKIDRDSVRQLLNELAFQAHRNQPDIMGTADISESELITGLMSLSRNPDVKPTLLIEFLSQRAGLLLPRGMGVYTFPHRTFQEYLAACYLTDHNFPYEVAELVRKDPQRWREIALLAGARASRGTIYALWSLVDELCFTDPPNNNAKVTDEWAALIAGELIVESGLPPLPNETRRMTSLERVRSWQVKILRSDQLPATERALAGRNLATLGDSRKGVLSVDEMPFCSIPAGPFLMGSDRQQIASATDAESPIHKFVIPYNYQLGRYPVTNAQFQQFIQDGGYQNEEYWQEAINEGIWENGGINGRRKPSVDENPFNLPNHPITGVSWYEAMAFVRWLTKKWHKQGRISSDSIVTLPSEAEWEKAARGDDNRKYPWGDTFDPDRANTAESAIGVPNAVGCFSKGTSPHGCEEMIGNVFEWTRSLYSTYPYDLNDGRENLFANRNELRVVRGGHFNDEGVSLSCSTREGIYPRHPLSKTGGFRVAIIPERSNQKEFSLEDLGWAFVQSISPTDERLAEINKILEELRSELSNYKAIQDAYADVIMYGSVARGTAIVPLADIDVLLLLKINPFKEQPGVALQIVRELLPHIYSRKQLVDARKARQARSFGASTIVQLPDRLRLEMTPAVLSPKDSTEILIPDWRVKQWVPSHHNKHANVATQLDQKSNGQFTALVKMFKYWYLYARRIRFLHSFIAECLVAANFEPATDDLLGSFENLLVRLQTRYKSANQLRRVPIMGVEKETKSSGIGTRQFQDLMAAIDTTLAEIRISQETDLLEKKVQQWRKVFGDKFPERLE